MKKYMLIILLSVLSVACGDFLDLTPEDATTVNSHFRTGKDAETTLNALMSMVRMTEQFDQVHWAAGLKMDSVSSKWDGYQLMRARNLEPRGYFSASWSNLYNLIYSANVILDNISRCELTEEQRDIYRLQAYFVKGISYFWIGRAWGEAPIVGNSNDMSKRAKSSAVEVMEEATAYALKAMALPKFENLTDYAGNPRATKQYASKGAAAALLANIYAWRASLENKLEFWREAEKYCTMIIENEVGTYKLAGNPEAVCSQVMKGESQEGIWEIYRTTDYPAEITEMAYYSEIMVGWPVREDAAVSFLQYNTAEIHKATVNAMYPRNDLRRQSYFYGIDSTSFLVTTREVKVVDGNVEVIIETKRRPYDMEKVFVNMFRFPFYTMDKYGNGKNFTNMAMNKVVWRLADIMLLRAECRSRLGSPNAMEDVIKVRDRAGLTGADLTDDCGGDIRLAVFKERERELLFEDHRFYDIVRNGLDYVRRELSPAYSRLTEQDVRDGALYYPVNANAFRNNDLMLQNVYWNTRAN